jgi:hypothetical protein
VQVFGYSTGFFNPSVTATVVEVDGDYYLSLSCGTANGDSGGPIYLVGSEEDNYNRLLGIVETTTGYGIVWRNIRDAYYNQTGDFLSAYTS